MKKTTMKLSLAAFAVLGSTTLFAGAVADGPQLVHSGETIHLDGSQSFAENGGYITGYKWYGVTSIFSEEASPNFTAPIVTKTTEFQYTLLAYEGIKGINGDDYTKNTITVIVEPAIGNPDANITHEGFTYGTVVSPATGRIWLDRNIGASQACTSETDSACYGGYYQWGRNTDGHQLPDSEITFVSLPSLDTISNEFIGMDYDNFYESYVNWADDDNNGSIRKSRWSATDGSSVCPIGYRVPTLVEMDKEIKSFDFLNLPHSGRREGSIRDDSFAHDAMFWTISLDSNTYYPSAYAYTSAYKFTGRFKTKSGIPVRCIKD